MRNFSVLLMNYRCFSGHAPVRWSFKGDSLTSFVGPNNAGKSTFLRLFYELRGVFQMLLTHQHFRQLLEEKNIGLPFHGVGDPAEIPSFHSLGPVIIEFGIDVSKGESLSKVRLTLDPGASGWVATIWAGPSQREVKHSRGQGFPGTVSTSAGMTPLDLSEFNSFLQCLSGQCLYIPAYRNLINQGGGTHYDVAVGQDFIKTWDSWKNGDAVVQRRTILAVIADIKNVFGFDDLNVEATPSKDTLQITVDGRSERIRELGAGLSQFIMVLGNVAMKRPEILFIDEPELNLHPVLQTKFLTALAKYSMHIVYASHSIGLSRAAEHVYSVTREDGTSVINPLPATRSYAELMGELSFAAYQELGFEQILCVEGIHDVLPVQQFLRLLSLDQKIVIIPLGGSAFINSNTAPQLNELKRISTKIAVLIDSEKDASTKPLAESRQGFISECQKLGFIVHVTDRRALEHYFSDSAIKLTKGPSFRALLPYEDFSSCSTAWPKNENWRIAQNMNLAELQQTDLGTWLSSLGNAQGLV